MVKIHKSDLVFLESNNPLILDMPDISVNLFPDGDEPEVIKPVEQNTEEIQKERADKIVEVAKKEAEQIIEDARQKADEILNEAMARGFEMGKVEGKQEIQEKLAAMEAQFDEFKENFNRKYDELFDSLQQNLLELSVSIAEKVINLELDRSDECYLSMVKKAISKLKKDEKANIRISQQDFDRFFPGIDKELKQYEGKISAVPDENLSKGDLIMETPNEIIDAGVNTQIKAIAACLYKG